MATYRITASRYGALGSNSRVRRLPQEYRTKREASVAVTALNKASRKADSRDIYWISED